MTEELLTLEEIDELKEKLRYIPFPRANVLPSKVPLLLGDWVRLPEAPIETICTLFINTLETQLAKVQKARSNPDREKIAYQIYLYRLSIDDNPVDMWDTFTLTMKQAWLDVADQIITLMEGER